MVIQKVWCALIRHCFGFLGTETASRSVIQIEPECAMSLQPFWQRVAETVAWCAPRANSSDPRHCLRSEEIRGRHLENSYATCVRYVAQNRKLSSVQNPPLAVTPDLRGGRLLLYFPDADLCDGAAEAESRGFFDVYNTPPWDTWLAFVSENEHDKRGYASYLVSWVPPVFLENVAAGIVVNPEECIQWLDESDVALKKLLQN